MNTGRNDLCPCGSGKKYKKCCGQNKADQTTSADEVAKLIQQAVYAYHHGDRLRAEVTLQHVLEVAPNNTEACFGLALIKLDQNRFDEAIQLYKKIIKLKPDSFDACNDLGAILQIQKKYSEAIEYSNKAIALNPNHVMPHMNLGAALRSLGKAEEAIDCYKKIISLNPNSVEAYYSLGGIYQDLNQFTEAGQYYEKTLNLNPQQIDQKNILNNLGLVQLKQGRAEQAIEIFRQAIKTDPDSAEAGSNLLLALNYVSSVTPQIMLAEHVAWATQFAEPYSQKAIKLNNDPKSDKKLKVGYVSADFRTHSVSYFIEPVLAAHDKNNIEVFCYSNSHLSDATTQRLKTYADYWIDIADLSDDVVAARIRSDAIDILIDLSGHTEGNRLLVFARKPAPVQITWIGYGNTTGLSAIDYRISDAIADPPGETERYHSEKLFRLPGCFSCYQPPIDAPHIAELPVIKNGHITFGCFNNPSKISDETMRLWGKILNAVPNSKLAIKGKGLEKDKQKIFFLEKFAVFGIAKDRIEFVGLDKTTTEHLTRYNQIDIALDTFPYNGVTTTAEALWMGVPVITLAGKTHVSRTGASLLWNVGLPQFIAQDQDQYLKIVVNAAQNKNELMGLRRQLRAILKESVLMNAEAFTHNLEALYRQAWVKWCGMNVKKTVNN